MTTNIRINGQRLWDSLMELARIGATAKGGVCRLALTDLDREARDLFVCWCKDAGCSVSVSSRDTDRAATRAVPHDPPARIPSSRVSRRAAANASRSLTRTQRSTTFGS